MRPGNSRKRRKRRGKEAGKTGDEDSRRRRKRMESEATGGRNRARRGGARTRERQMRAGWEQEAADNAIKKTKRKQQEGASDELCTV